MVRVLYTIALVVTPLTGHLKALGALQRGNFTKTCGVCSQVECFYFNILPCISSAKGQINPTYRSCGKAKEDIHLNALGHVFHLLFELLINGG